MVTLQSSIEDHARKQVQMHTVARHLAKKFSSHSPKSFGESFSYNKAFYAVWDGTPVTVEEFVAGEFTKYINNDGMCTRPSEISERCEEVFQKVELLCSLYLCDQQPEIHVAGYSGVRILPV